MTMQKIARIMASLAGGLLTACSFAPTVAEHGVAYNQAVAEAANDQMLLNILRAKDNEPLYFTSFSLIRGNIKQTADLELKLPFGGDATDLYTFTPGLTQSTNPTFDIAIHDSQEFMRGILNPIALETFQYYYEIGWPRELVLNVLVESVEIDGEVFINDPTRPAQHRGFQRLMRDLLARNLTIGKVETITPVGPPLSLRDQASVDALSALVQGGMEKAGLVLSEHPQGYRLQRRQLRPALFVDGPGGVRTLVPHLGEAAAGDAAPVQLRLRSVQGVIYFLGRILRGLERGLPVPMVAIEAEGIQTPLFLARPGGAGEVGLVRAVHHDVEYLIPGRGEAGRSMSVLTVLAQLIAQNKSAKTLPTTGAVTVIGQ